MLLFYHTFPKISTCGFGLRHRAPSILKPGDDGMHTGKVEIIGIDTSRLAVLSEQEKLELLQRARNGDKAALCGWCSA